MKVSDMTKTAWRSGDIVQVTYQFGNYVRPTLYNRSGPNFHNLSDRERNRRMWRMGGTDRIEAEVIEVSKDLLIVTNRDTGDWHELWDFMIDDIVPISMNAWR